MSQRAFVAGVGMTPFGRHADKTQADLAHAAVDAALKDATLDRRAVRFVAFGNCMAGALESQQGIRGEVVLRRIGLTGLPVVNVENACATGSTALSVAVSAVRSGLCEVALAVGVEKMYVGSTKRTLDSMRGFSDFSEEGRRGIFYPGIYAVRLREYMHRSGAKLGDLALAAVKNQRNAILNPNAQFGGHLTVEQVLTSKSISPPLTQYMISGIGDGAAAIVVVSEAMARRIAARVEIAACVLSSAGYDEHREPGTMMRRIAGETYELAGVGPADVSVAEVHDAVAGAELPYAEYLGFFPHGGAAAAYRDHITDIGGKLPINTGGGLTGRGHPLAATGLVQITELTWQLRGQAGSRQVRSPRVALAQNGGGYTAGETAAMAITVLTC